MWEIGKEPDMSNLHYRPLGNSDQRFSGGERAATMGWAMSSEPWAMGGP